MQHLSAPAGLELSFRSDLDILVVRWQPAAFAEMRRCYAHILEVARSGPYHYWLLDIRRRSNADLPTLLWLTEEYFPSLATHLGRGVSISYLLSPQHLYHLSAEPGIPALAERITATYRIREHADELEATQWLQRQQTLVGGY